MRKTPKKIIANDRYQRDYEYVLTEPEGKNFAPDFKPELTPAEMLALGVFGGAYFTNGSDEFPHSWFTNAKRSVTYDKTLNYFKVRASQPLSEWQKKGWIYADDPRGWFQWYCRYYLGRRIPEEDARQIKRWKAFTRHKRAVEANCTKGDMTCRPVQRQALLHWAYDARKI